MGIEHIDVLRHNGESLYDPIVLTLWRQYGDETMKFLGRHIEINKARILIDIYRESGFTVIDYGSKITVQ